MNKLFAIASLSLIISVTGCGGGKNSETTTPAITTPPITTTPPTTPPSPSNGVYKTVSSAPTTMKRKIAIVYSKTSEQNFWTPKSYSQLFMSVQTQAIMAGLPFDLLNEDDLLDINKISQYKTLVFPFFSYANSTNIAQISTNLKTAVAQYNVGIVTAGNFLTNTETGATLSGDSYIHMKNILGITRVEGAGPVDFKINTSTINHPAFINEYTNNETVLSYSQNYTDYFASTGAYPSEVLATQEINSTQVENALITVTNQGRHAHFATVQSMADANLLWPILQWSVWGEKSPATLHIGRDKAVFVSRNDMDQSMFLSEVPTVEVPLFSQLKIWKDKYDFVGSYYINIGNDATADQVTDWSVSAPLYQQYIGIGNEIGTHSYTHPANTDVLTSAQLKFEFADSRTIIEREISLSDIGAAVPGNPESLQTAQTILSHVDYLSGGYSALGAGFPNAFGFLDADSTKVYLSPNMSFDFTLVQFQNKTAAQAKQIWFEEFDALTKHAKQPIIHWPWHDYGPFDTFQAGYNVDMFDGFIAKAKSYGSEFITGKDLSQRIKAFKTSNVDIVKSGTTITANVSANNAGQFSIKLEKPQTIASVDNWYAYNNDTVFLGQKGGSYNIQLGSAKPVTRINQLPSRSKLVSLLGNGEDLKFRLSGAGKVEITTACTNPSSIKVSGGVTTYTTSASNKISINFPSNQSYPETTVDITCP